MSGWIPRLLSLLSAGIPVVRMAVAGVQGSAPREPGASLLYWRDVAGQVHSHGSVGGGRLEAQAMEIAQFLLDPHTAAVAGATVRPGRRRVERFTLGASLGQCCGGVVQMYWERFDELSQARLLLHPGLAGTEVANATDAPLRYCALDGSDREWQVRPEETAAHDLPAATFAGRAGLVRGGAVLYFVERLHGDATALWLYGAGHVGRALVHVLADLPFRLTWIDSRPDTLEQGMAGLPALRRDEIAASADDPQIACAAAPSGAWHVVMTHCHDQDLRTCESLLSGGRFEFLGLIGSRTKAARFRHRLRERGIPPEQIDRLVCPIGIDGIRDREPAAIAIAVAGQLLQRRALGHRLAAPAPEPGDMAHHG